MLPLIINITRVDPKNIGDVYSSPVRYFPFLKNAEVRDIWDENIASNMDGAIVIVGGGGLIANESFKTEMQSLLKTHPSTLIAWGIGHNRHGATRIRMPRYLRKYGLVGVRDVGTPYCWVPCASCMHTVFDQKYDIRHDIVIYQHPDFSPIADCGSFPVSSNTDFSRIEDAIAFIGSGATVLTSSYHGAYWATLLGRRVVIVEPFSSKFFGMKFPHPIATKSDWKYKISETCSYSDALQECRDANRSFASQAQEIIGTL